jgi:HD-GYP domain-containing protein (c-di-GMP phosphodiesterase class II)
LDQALEILQRLRGVQLDPNVLDALKRVVEKKLARTEEQRQPAKIAS